jgi:hypothetical protein
VRIPANQLAQTGSPARLGTIAFFAQGASGEAVGHYSEAANLALTRPATVPQAAALGLVATPTVFLAVGDPTAALDVTTQGLLAFPAGPLPSGLPRLETYAGSVFEFRNIALPMQGYSLTLRGVAWWNCHALAHGHSSQPVPLPFAGAPNGPAWFGAHGTDAPLGLFVDVHQNGRLVATQNLYVPWMGQLYGHAAQAC